MNANDLTALPWSALLFQPDGTIASSPNAKRLLGFSPTDCWALERRIDIALPSGTPVGELGLPWRRSDVPFEEYQTWHDRLLGRWTAMRVRGAHVPGGLMLGIEPDQRPLRPTERAEEALSAIQQSLLSGRFALSLRGLLRMLVELVCELTQARYGAIGVLQRNASSLRDFVFVGIGEEAARAIGHLPEGKGLLGTVIREARTVRVERIAEDPRSSGFPAHHPPMSSFLGVPLRIGDRVFGNFYVCEKQGAPSFTEDDARCLERFSAQAAMAVAFVERIEEEQRFLFRSLVEHAPYAMVFFPAGRTGEPFGNVAAERMLGRISPATDSGSSYQLVLPDGSAFPEGEEPERQAMRGEILFNVEALVTRPDVQPHIPVLISAAPVLSEDGATLGSLVVYQDISTIKELQRLREEFAAIVAHDMRTPVQSVMLQIEALLRRASGEAALVPLVTLHNMKRNGEYLARLISELLDASHLDSHQLSINRQVFDAGEELRALLLRLRPALGERSVDLQTHGAASVNADPLRFDQIFTNVIENAAKYSPEQSPIHVTVAPARGGALVTVQDWGVGIAPEEIPHLFERYYRGQAKRTGRRGLGLGLYIAHALTEMHGGTLNATSTLGAGSTFELWLPGPPQQEDAPQPVSGVAL